MEQGSELMDRELATKVSRELSGNCLGARGRDDHGYEGRPREAIVLDGLWNVQQPERSSG